MWLIFVLLAGLKYRIGSDTYFYLRFYDSIKPINIITVPEILKDRYAPGFVVLNSIFRTFTSDFTAFQIFHALFVCSSVFIFLNRYAKHFFFALLLFFFFQYTLFFFEQIRESMAVAVFLFAWPCFVKREWWKWYLWCFLALMFHISSVVLLILPAITLPGVRQMFIFGQRTWIICVAIFLIGLSLQFAFFKYIQMLEIADAITERAQVYSKSRLSGNTLNVLGVLGQCFIYVLYPILALYFNHKNKKLVYDKRENGFNPYDAMILTSIYVSILTISISILSRYNNYFFIFVILNISSFAYSYIPVFKKFIRLKYAYWILLFLPFIGWNFSNNYLRSLNKSGTLKGYMLYSPYASCFDQTIDKNREDCIRYGIRFGK